MKKLLWIAGGIICCLIVGMVFAWTSLRWHPSDLIVSKETTYITSPLRADGSPDYYAAINSIGQAGVTPENNSAVLIMQAVGPHEIEASKRKQFFAKLGMEAPSPIGEYFEEWGKYWRKLEPATPDGASAEEIEASQARWQAETERFEAADSRTLEWPWKESEYPEVAAWLKKNKPYLALAEAASRRPKQFVPVVRASEHDSIIDVQFPFINIQRQCALALGARSMLHLGDGRVEAAWNDTETIARMGRLIQATDGTLVEGLVGIAIEGIASSLQHVILGTASLPPAKCQRAIATIDQANQTTLPFSRRLAHGDRFVALDAMCAMAKNRIQSSDSEHQIGLEYSTPYADWNATLRLYNELMDRAAAIGKATSPQARQAAIAQYDSDIAAMGQRVKEAPNRFTSVLNPWIARRYCSEQVASLFGGANTAAYSAEGRNKTNRDLLRMALALAWYKGERGKYPAALTDLVPKYLPSIPVDDFHGHPFVYQLKPDGYLLYSFGRNGVDEKGVDWNIDPDTESDDNNARVPAVKPVPPKVEPTIDPELEEPPPADLTDSPDTADNADQPEPDAPAPPDEPAK